MAVATLTQTGYTLDHLSSGNPGYDIYFEYLGVRYIISGCEGNDWFTGDSSRVAHSVAHKSTDNGATYSIVDSALYPTMPNGKPHLVPLRVGTTVYLWGTRNESDFFGYTEDQTLTLLQFSLVDEEFGSLISGGPNIGPDKTAGESPSDSLLIARGVADGLKIRFVHSSGSEKVSTVWRQRVSQSVYDTDTGSWSETTQLGGQAGNEKHYHPIGVVADSSGNIYYFFSQHDSPFTNTLWCQFNDGTPVQVVAGLGIIGTQTGASKPILWKDGDTDYIGILANKDGTNNELYFYYSQAGQNSWTEELVTDNANYHNSVNMGEMAGVLVYNDTADSIGVQVGVDGTPDAGGIGFTTRIDADELTPDEDTLYAFWYRQSSEFAEVLDAWVEYSTHSISGWNSPTKMFDIPRYDDNDLQFTHSIHSLMANPSSAPEAEWGEESLALEVGVSSDVVAGVCPGRTFTGTATTEADDEPREPVGT